MSIDITKLFPQIYRELDEFKEIIDTENLDLTQAETELHRCLNNQFIMTSDEMTIQHLEIQFGIIANIDVETLEFRRARLINRVSTQPPFTTIFLRNKLDGIIGKDQYKAYIDYDEYTLYIESTAKNQVYNHEILVTLNTIKPANIVYINIPTIITPLLVGETISKATLVWNYKLGTQWILGTKPFLSFTNEEVFKLANIPSITEDGIISLCNSVDSSITKAIINNTFEVNEFISKGVTLDNETVISYSVPMISNISVINNIKLTDNVGTVYFDSNVYIPVEQEVVMKHTIRFAEG